MGVILGNRDLVLSSYKELYIAMQSGTRLVMLESLHEYLPSVRRIEMIVKSGSDDGRSFLPPTTGTFLPSFRGVDPRSFHVGVAGLTKYSVRLKHSLVLSSFPTDSNMSLSLGLIKHDLFLYFLT